MTTAARHTERADLPRASRDSEVGRVGAVDPLPVPVRCVGAFLRPCLNLTDTILCAGCYTFIDRTLQATHRRAAAATRTVYQRHNGKSA